MTNIALIGAGAIGGMFASRLERSGIPVNLLVRPQQAQALRERGLRVREHNGAEFTTQSRVSADAHELGVQDIVIVCVKAPALVASAPSFAPLVGPGTLIVPAINGIPWWFFDGFGGSLAGARLQTVDPQGLVARALPPAQCMGCVVYLAASVGPDGMVQCGASMGLELGDASRGADHARVAPVAALLRRAGFDVRVSDEIRYEVWRKLWGNLPMNPMSALTGSTIDALLAQDETRALAIAMMQEHQALGHSLGLDLGMTVAKRMEGMRALVGVKTSMLQDMQAGRPLEIDGIVGAVAEIAALAGVATPFTSAVLGLIRLRAENAGLYTPAGGRRALLGE